MEEENQYLIDYFTNCGIQHTIQMNEALQPAYRASMTLMAQPTLSFLVIIGESMAKKYGGKLLFIL